MKKVLVTGGTVFVSRFVAEYYVKKGYDVSVLNRNTRKQSENVTLIQADRNDLDKFLHVNHFDIIFDITAYTADDINDLLDSVGGFDDYIMISSGAVYPEYEKQPFTEHSKTGINKYWLEYGTDKINAEQALLKRCPDAYIIRPPYLYGPMNNLYRESFVFECAEKEREFYLPNDGEMKLQFFHVEDLCRFMDAIIDQKPSQHIFNVGNKDSLSVKDWVTLCYKVVGKTPVFRNVYEDIFSRKYFSFGDYQYILDVTEQEKLIHDTKPMELGLKESYEWYINHTDEIEKNPLIEFIDENLR